jgi:hypothetical protein
VWAALVRKRERWTLTWIGWLLALGLFVAAGVTVARGLGNFLAISQPVGGQFLVVDAWMPAFAYREAANQFRSGHYVNVIAVGVLQEDDQFDGKIHEFAAVGKLIGAGIPAERVIEAAGSGVLQDRTFHSAMSVKGWLEKQGLRSGSLDVLTLGPHARRSRLLYEKAKVFARLLERPLPTDTPGCSSTPATLAAKSIVASMARVFNRPRSSTAHFRISS